MQFWSETDASGAFRRKSGIHPWPTLRFVLQRLEIACGQLSSGCNICTVLFAWPRSRSSLMRHLSCLVVTAPQGRRLAPVRRPTPPKTAQEPELSQFVPELRRPDPELRRRPAPAGRARATASRPGLASRGRHRYRGAVQRAVTARGGKARRITGAPFCFSDRNRLPQSTAVRGMLFRHGAGGADWPCPRSGDRPPETTGWPATTE